MLTVRRRGKTFHADMVIGDIRVRGALGTRNHDAARRLTHRLETALSEGATSSLWPELRTLLPRLTYVRFADYVGAKDQQVPTWDDLRQAFTTDLGQRRNIGKLQRSTE